jgi:hypothetical protein
MNIKDFKVGEIITRNEPMRYAHNGSADSSWCGDRIEFLGLDETAKIIFVRLGEPFDEDKEPHTLSYARDAWDEGWTKFPESMFKKLFKSPK